MSATVPAWFMVRDCGVATNSAHSLAVLQGPIYRSVEMRWFVLCDQF